MNSALNDVDLNLLVALDAPGAGSVTGAAPSPGTKFFRHGAGRLRGSDPQPRLLVRAGRGSCPRLMRPNCARAFPR